MKKSLLLRSRLLVSRVNSLPPWEEERLRGLLQALIRDRHVDDDPFSRWRWKDLEAAFGEAAFIRRAKLNLLAVGGITRHHCHGSPLDGLLLLVVDVDKKRLCPLSARDGVAYGSAEPQPGDPLIGT
jgi:hypothetical protein